MVSRVEISSLPLNRVVDSLVLEVFICQGFPIEQELGRYCYFGFITMWGASDVNSYSPLSVCSAGIAPGLFPAAQLEKLMMVHLHLSRIRTAWGLDGGAEDHLRTLCTC